jgi:two-component sensor histidine kinase
MRRLERLRRFRRHPFYGPLLAVALTALATIIRVSVPPGLPFPPFLVFFIAAVLSTALGGARAGILALALSAVAADWFVFDPGRFLPRDWAAQISFAAFLFATLLIILVIGMLNRIVDRLGEEIEERAALERRADVLTNEVRHRARNLLTLVQAIARKSLPPEQSDRFGKALTALARTQDIFGASQAVTLASLLESELTGFPDQVTIQGCRLMLSPHSAQDFALIVHELAANALKHGALSAAEGKVRIAGTPTGDGRYVLLWQEEGGPAPKSEIQDGFGRTILQELARDFASEVEMALEPSGLRYKLVAQTERIADKSETEGEPV